MGRRQLKVFVDTSAILALVDSSDEGHTRAVDAFDTLLDDAHEFVTHNYVVLETIALLHRRIGVDAVSQVSNDFFSEVDVVWIDPSIHHAALRALLAGRRRQLSLVDQVSFEVMRRQAIETAFALDPDFSAAGFDVVPSG